MPSGRPGCTSRTTGARSLHGRAWPAVGACCRMWRRARAGMCARVCGRECGGRGRGGEHFPRPCRELETRDLGGSCVSPPQPAWGCAGAGQSFEGGPPAGLPLQWHAMTVWLQDDGSPVRTLERMCVSPAASEPVCVLNAKVRGTQTLPGQPLKRKTLSPNLKEPKQLK